MFWKSVLLTRDLARLHEIAAVLVRFGFADAVRRVGLAGALARAGHRLHSGPNPPEPSAAALRRALETLGPTFVKLGQVLASRVDLFGPEWIAELEKLQNHVPPVPFGTLRGPLEVALGEAVESAFATFDTTPLAAASIAQVHRASLHDGTDVVVKIRRPGIREIVAADLRLLERLARILEARSPEVARYRPCAVVRHFRASIERELDLAAECHHAERIARALKAMPGIVVPRVHWRWTSESVNVQDYLPGPPLQDLLEPGRAAAAGADLPAIARTGAAAVLQMVLVDGFFHADPHGGNVVHLHGDRIGLIDFGMVGILSPRRRAQLLALLQGLVERRTLRVADALEQWTDAGFDDPDVVLEDLEAFLDRYHGVPLARIHLGEMLLDVAGIVRAHGLALPPDLAVVIKVFVTLEGLGRRLDPGFDMVAAARPFLRRLQREQASPRAMARAARTALAEAAAGLAALPRDVRRLLRAAGDGRLAVHVETPQLAGLGERLSHAANRLAIGLVIAALIVGTSIVMASGVGPVPLGLRFFALAGFVIAIAGGLWLVVSVLRSGGGR